MRIQTRLMVFYLSVVALVASLGWVTYQNSLSVQAEYHGLADETLPVVKAINEVRFHSMQLIATSADLLLLHSFYAVDSHVESTVFNDEVGELAEAQVALRLAFDHYRSLVERFFPEELGLLEALELQVSALLTRSEEILELAKTQQVGSSAFAAQQLQIEQIEETILSVIERVLEHEEEESEERHEKVLGSVTYLSVLLLLGGAVILLVALLLAWGTGRFISRPIAYLVEGFNAIAAGRSVSVSGPAPVTEGELGTLLNSFEKMRIDLQARESELQLSRDYLERILESMEDILIAVDGQGLILRANRSACEQLGYSREDLLGQELALIADNEVCQTSRRSDLSGHMEAELRHRDGHHVQVLVSLNRVELSADAGESVVLIATNISERKVAEEKVHRLAFYDPLSGLPNRTLFFDRLAQAVKFAVRQEQMLAVLFLDVDNFKQINDTLGHDVGDEMIRAVSERLTQAVREVDIRLRGVEEVLRPVVSRYGGDEFLILLPHIERADVAEAIAERILQAFEAPVVLGVHKLFSSISIGIAVAPSDGTDARILVQNADTALYRAKAEGKKRYRSFEPQMNSSVIRRVEIENSLRRGIENREFELYYQPQLDLTSGEVLGAEALIRWNHPQWGLVPPLEFIPVAERCGLMVPLGEWVLTEACVQWQRWRTVGYEPGKLSVNLSAVQLEKGHFVETLERILAQTAMSPSTLVLELTESVLMTDVMEASQQLSAVRSTGVSLAVDDFGTGYSSLSYLKSFPLDYVKIDRSFVRDLESSDSDLELVRTIIAMARGLGMRLIAEGVETPGQLQILKQLDCDVLQGYLLGRPVPAEEFERALLSPAGQQSHKGLELCRVALH